ncbi:MAG: hypothetical protein M3Q10_11555 [Chloroflexota bacterium]|nr:hypothetical protein [Chloroflexota bacterium]
MRIRGIALVAGLGLALGVAAPAAAQDVDGDVLAEDVVTAIPVVGVGEAVEEVFENLGLEDEEGEFVTTDATPFNPIDDEGSVTTVFVDDVVFASEVEETEE